MTKFLPHWKLWVFMAVGGLAAIVQEVGAKENGEKGKTEKLQSAADMWASKDSQAIPSFDRHVMPMIGKVGCNNRACHGSFQGQAGFRLSLFGHDPKMDHDELTVDEGNGPRISLKAPENSLLLLKPTLKEPHDGGERFKKDSWTYHLLLNWVKNGANRDAADAPKLTKVEVFPPAMQLLKPPATNAEQQLLIVATFSDGSQEDVTPLTIFSTNDETVAEVNEAGLVQSVGYGDTAIVATYAGVVITTQVIVPFPQKAPFPDFAANNSVDKFVATKLQKMGIHPSDLCSDEVFLRRVFLDLIGTLPTAKEAHAFLDSKEADKRSKLIAQLLERPEYAIYWATKFSDWTGNDNRFTPQPREKSGWLWYDWLHHKLANNVPYDELVAGIVTATTREGRSVEETVAEFQAIKANVDKGFDEGVYAARKTNDIFWQKATNRNANTVALQTAYAFLGVRLECAQCHKHPFDRWTQNDFQSFTAFFSVVSTGVPKDVPKDVNGKVAKNGYKFNEVFIDLKRSKAKPKLLGGDMVAVEEGSDPRVALMNWMRSPDNNYFARAIANRLWGHYFGVGIVDPVDDLNAANPPSNPELLNWLAQDFIEHKFDLKHLHSTILNSRTYQLSWEPNESNQLDERNFSHALLRRMPAEVVLDAINQITGATDSYGNNAPKGTRAIGLAPSRLRGGGPEYALSVFGRPLRTQLCDCERSGETGLAQAMYLLNDTDINTKIASDKGQLAGLLKDFSDDGALIEELFLSTLSRYPTAEEKKRALDFVGQASNRAAVMHDMMWSLINVREFIFVH